MTAHQTVRIDADGRAFDIEYAWVGARRHDGGTMVFLHEGLGSLAMWKDYPQHLCHALQMRGLVYSRPGYGRSTPRDSAERWPVDFMHEQARHVLPALLETLHVPARPWLFGHSDGGSIALLHAASFPASVAGVIAVAPHLFVEDVSVRNITAAKAAYEQGDLRQKLARYHADPDSAFWGWNDIWLHADFRQWNIEAEMPAIRCPVLAVQGIGDEYGTMAQIDRLAALVPQARLVKLAACGHSPHRDQPNALTDAAVDFVSTTETRVAQ
jgi:pimeloyl-ACP methyl ester carboxylesterase